MVAAKGPLTVYQGWVLVPNWWWVLIHAGSIVCHLARRPRMVQCMEGLDVVDDHLVCWVHVFVAVDVKGGIQCASIVVSQLLRQSCTKCHPVVRCQTLSLESP